MRLFVFYVDGCGVRDDDDFRLALQGWILEDFWGRGFGGAVGGGWMVVLES